MIRRAGKPLVVLLAIMPAVVAAGCARPDRWAFLERYARQAEQREDVRAASVSADRYRPKLSGPTSRVSTDAEPVDLSIEQATMLVLANNRDLNVEIVNPLIAKAFEKIEGGVFDPELFAEFEHARETAQETARSTGGSFNSESRDSTSEAGIRQLLPTGTDVEFSVGHERSSSNRAPELQEARVGLTVTQALLRGLRGLNLVGGDVVEVAPPFDPTGNTALVAATMMYEILCLLAEAVASRK